MEAAQSEYNNIELTNNASMPKENIHLLDSDG